MHPAHKDLLAAIRIVAGKPVQDPFLNNYLGNPHPRYTISTPALRNIAKDWSRTHRDLTPPQIAKVVTSLVQGESFTEKALGGILLGYTTKEQRALDPEIFDAWLDHLVGWAEVDALCSGDFVTTQLPADWTRWKKLITRLSKDENINKRRASLVLFCSPLLRRRDERLCEAALQRVDRLRSEKEGLITKAVSWVLRSLVKHHRREVSAYLEKEAAHLPRIAVRETQVKLATGRKGRSQARA